MVSRPHGRRSVGSITGTREWPHDRSDGSCGRTGRHAASAGGHRCALRRELEFRRRGQGAHDRISHRDSGEHVVNVETDDRTRFQNPIRWTATLAPGVYTFEVFTGVGPHHFEEFEVESLDPAEVPWLEADLH